MKSKTWMLVIPFILLFFAIFIWHEYYNIGSQRAKKINFQNQLGSYKLDFSKTDLGSYIKDTALYRNLTLTFKKDSTFILNFKVPFIYDSAGKWIASGNDLDDWNWIYYHRNNNIRTQFTQVNFSDSTFYLNSTTPQEDSESIKEIYFKKKIP